jgi:hypothetical protein
MTETVTLYRPVDAGELRLIEAADMRAFPPRRPEQPIFYPVLNEQYAVQIARDWNARVGSKTGYVTRFAVRKSFLDQYRRRVVGAREHEEYWIPAEDLPAFNDSIVGTIEVIGRFGEADRMAVAADVDTEGRQDRKRQL